MWQTLKEYPLLGIGPALAAAWAVWRSWGSFSFPTSKGGELAAWELLATKYKPSDTLHSIRKGLMEEAVPWPEEGDEEGKEGNDEVEE